MGGAGRNSGSIIFGATPLGKDKEKANPIPAPFAATRPPTEEPLN